MSIESYIHPLVCGDHIHCAQAIGTNGAQLRQEGEQGRESAKANHGDGLKTPLELELAVEHLLRTTGGLRQPFAKPDFVSWDDDILIPNRKVKNDPNISKPCTITRDWSRASESPFKQRL